MTKRSSHGNNTMRLALLSLVIAAFAYTQIPRLTAQVSARKPVGAVDQVSRNPWQARGWGCDEDDPARALSVHAYKVVGENAQLLPPVTANRPGGPNPPFKCSVNGSHGFLIDLPRPTGAGYELHVYLIDNANGHTMNTLIAKWRVTRTSVTKLFQDPAGIPPPPPQDQRRKPIGSVTAKKVSGRTELGTWMCDQDTPTQPGVIHIYKEKSADRIEILAAVTADQPGSGPPSSCPGNHRFKYLLPAPDTAAGETSYKVRVYFVDTTHEPNNTLFARYQIKAGGYKKLSVPLPGQLPPDWPAVTTPPPPGGAAGGGSPTGGGANGDSLIGIGTAGISSKTATNGVRTKVWRAYGWACDNQDPLRDVNVQAFKINANGTRTLLGEVQANLGRGTIQSFETASRTYCGSSTYQFIFEQIPAPTTPYTLELHLVNPRKGTSVLLSRLDLSGTTEKPKIVPTYGKPLPETTVGTGAACSQMFAHCQKVGVVVPPPQNICATIYTLSMEPDGVRGVCTLSPEELAGVPLPSGMDMTMCLCALCKIRYGASLPGQCR